MAEENVGFGAHRTLFRKSPVLATLPTRPSSTKITEATEITILFKIITRMKLSFSIYLGDCSYSFQCLSNKLALQLQFPWFSSRMQLQEIIPLRNFQEFPAITVT